MKDPHTTVVIGLFHPKVRQSFTSFIEDAETALGITLRVAQGLRTFPEQDAIYAKGRTVPGPGVSKKQPMGETLTDAKGGQSYHNYGLAVDLVPVRIEKGKEFLDWEYHYQFLVPYAARYGITWGGNFPKPDVDHFENKPFHWKILLAKYKAGDFIPGTHYVNI